MTATTHLEVQSLSAELKSELSKITALDCIIPPLSELEDQDFRIWETPTNDTLLRPLKLVATPSEWALESGEQMLFQEFAILKSQKVEGYSQCIVLFLVKEDIGDARLVALDQNRSTLIDIECTSKVKDSVALRSTNFAISDSAGY